MTTTKTTKKTAKKSEKPAEVKAAEAVKFEAEATEIRQRTVLSAQRQAVEIRKIEAEAQKAAAEAEKARMEVEGSRILLDQALRNEKELLAHNAYHHVYSFSSGVADQSVASCMQQLDLWDRTEPDCDVTIIFNSPGGNVIAGMALFDYITQFRARGHKVTTMALGYAASMAGILLQAGDVRVMGKESYLLIHEIATLAMGKIGEIEDEVKFVKKIQSRVLDIFAARSRMSKAQLQKHWERKDWWLDSDEAMKLGIVDEVR